ncbi:MAG: translation initiation factor IF-2 [Erysipelotrichaceae bacterium]|nr:translation initiation factor IF-2 [Erysipelotrichaceae bacterium]
MAKGNRNNNNNRNRNRRGDFSGNYTKRNTETVKDCTYKEGITVKELAEKIGKSPAEIIKFLFMMGQMVTINASLDDETIQLIAMQYGIEITKEESEDENSLEDTEEDDPKDLEPRAPIVTIMGHVDHGKTTLLDNIRKTHVTASEFGGITQHIGAYQVEVKGQKVTFLDTPGHEAFTAMRARGAKMTDIVVIVVAADDGVMPQTKEAIDHSRAAGVPMIVAVNKIDKHNANVDKVYSEMADYDLMPEEWGGTTMFTKLSAKSGLGISDLLEMILLQAEMMELKANPNKKATGTVVEAKLDKGRGPVATLLVQNGTLHTGDMIVAGTAIGRIRKMTDDKGMEIKNAKPSTPVEIIGLDSVPEAGDHFKAFENEKLARKIADERNKQKIESERRTTAAMSLDDLTEQIKEGNVQEVNIIIKADVNGSAEAVKSSMEKVNVDGVKVNVIRATAGAISESDIMLANASNAIIYGFNVRPSAAIKKAAEENGVSIRLHNIIYKALEELEALMKGMLAPVYEEVVTGQATVKQTYKVSKVGTIAGCMVDDGVIKRNSGVRLIRDGVVIYTGVIGSLQRFKDSVREVNAGYECGLTIERFNDIKEGDIIEAYENQEVKED